MGVLIDTNVLAAYSNKDDSNHYAAKFLLERAVKGEFGTIFISDYVFDEFTTLTCARLGKKKAVELGNWLASSLVVFEYANESEFKDAWKVFCTSSNLSFTDAMIVVIARRKKAAVLTFDKWFAQFKDVRIITE